MLHLDALDRTIATLTERLLARRVSSGHWEGHLASSALATATATTALMVAGHSPADAREPLVARGLAWLTAHQHADGGWGDTTTSPSNVSTTALCWAALSLGVGRHDGAQATLARATRWLEADMGDLSPDALRRTLLARYGRDRTFSVPILTVLALAGRLGEGEAAWRRVPQLPFELAVLPHAWFRIVRLPVVSYALPALVAMGHVRHHRAPSRNPLLSKLRSALYGPTLRVAREMQPYSGGFLEATPLTAFVVMSLAAAGSLDTPIVTHGIRFLCASARPDGSWPIDTNLATWVTTLSVDALGDEWPEEGRTAIAAWLTGQQVTEEHPFTRAQPGGWAWTDLPGGVPDADDTAGALLALRALAGPECTPATVAGLEWLLALQNGDGGVPTFCRGWGALPFDRSAADLTAHAVRAWHAWDDRVPHGLQQRMRAARAHAMTFLTRRQARDGSWAPLWFGNQYAPGEENRTYGTSRVVAALATSHDRTQPAVAACMERGVAWLVAAQGPDGGWGGAAGVPASIEETGVALQALASAAALTPTAAVTGAVARGAEWIVRVTGEGRETPASPIGLYFARLWYDEELYPVIFALRGLREACYVLRTVGQLSSYRSASEGSDASSSHSA